MRVPIMKRTLRGLGWRRRVGVTEGFVTTRFVEADSAAEASRQAIEIVESQLAAIVGADAVLDSGLSVDEVSVDPPVLPESGPPGTGFTWF